MDINNSIRVCRSEFVYVFCALHGLPIVIMKKGMFCPLVKRSDEFLDFFLAYCSFFSWNGLSELLINQKLVSTYKDGLGIFIFINFLAAGFRINCRVFSQIAGHPSLIFPTLFSILILYRIIHLVLQLYSFRAVTTSRH